jgi:AcrR family transcriptional regulator
MSKGDETRERIVDRAWRLASRDGLSGLTLGRLASELGLSKSGLFAHFGSKEGLELEILKRAAEAFVEQVVEPARSATHGARRLRQLFENWLRWVSDPAMPGGCVFLAAAAELDDKPGPQRDFLVSAQSGFLGSIAREAELALADGQFKKTLDRQQFAFEMLGIVLAYHHSGRLLGDEKALLRARTAFEQLLLASQPEE